VNQEEAFIAKNIGLWTKLEEYNKRLSKKSISKFSRDEVKEYTVLFRTASHHLSQAKTYYEGSKCIDYLNQLLGISHSFFYTRQKAVWYEIIHYFAVGFPSAFRARFTYFIASVCAFLVGVCCIMFLAYQDNSYMFYFSPEDIVDRNNITSELSDRTSAYPLWSSYIMTNNIRVCALVIAYGVSFGVGTVYILLYNGLSLGAFFVMALIYDMPQLRFLSLLLPHGFIELTAIFIGGAAGLIIGKAMLVPGDLTRLGSFVKGAKEAFYFLPGLTVMLIIAGIIEGFFTPLNIGDAPKLVFAFFTLILTVSYFGLCGREGRERKQTFG
jgi:uncharacterized membrane protein SpoIIM required for sporulation